MRMYYTSPTTTVAVLPLPNTYSPLEVTFERTSTDPPNHPDVIMCSTRPGGSYSWRNEFGGRGLLTPLEVAGYIFTMMDRQRTFLPAWSFHECFEMVNAYANQASRMLLLPEDKRVR